MMNRSAHCEMISQNSQEISLSLSGELSAHTVGPIWTEVTEALKRHQPKSLRLQAEGVLYCDGAGAALFLQCQQFQASHKGACEVLGLKADIQKLIEIYTAEKPAPAPEAVLRLNLIEKFGRTFLKVSADIYDQIVFIGQLTANLYSACLNPRKYIRWKDVWAVVDFYGMGAVLIVVLINFLMGLIMAFQSAIPLQMMGADIYVADLVGVSIIRVLGPLMTAVVLTGRTGSAFAAELGTMKVNDEISALKTMGLDPVRFLVVNRVIGLMILFPVLVLVADGAGVLGGSVIFKSLGYPFRTYFDRVIEIVRLQDFLGGFIKSFAFGLVIAAIGCLRGLQAKNGPSAVGEAATRAVVSGLIAVMVIEGVFSVVYYYLGI